MIEISSVSHRIGATQILDDISLALPRGRITALIGPNGAGKSTLIGLIGRLTALQSGRIAVDGADLTRTDSRALARRLAILPQQATVASRLRVRELVSFGRWPHSAGRLTGEDHAKVDAAIAAMDLAPLAHRFLDALSGGQRQRAHMAMALAQDTDWLLLDEPLAALDMAHARGLMARLASLRDAGRSVVVVLHDVNHAARWADHVIALKSGRVAAQGTPQEVFAPELLGRIYDMDLRVETFAGRPLVLHHL